MPDGWMAAAACRGYPTAWWYPDRTEQAKTMLAKSICDACPVAEECLAFALDLPPHEQFGIWGGVSVEQERKRRASAAKWAS